MLQLQTQQHESINCALSAAQQEAQQLSSAKQQAEATQQELTLLRSAHEALSRELAVAKAQLAGADATCQHSLDRVQSLSAALQEAQQAAVRLSLSALHACLLFMPLHRKQQWASLPIPDEHAICLGVYTVLCSCSADWCKCHLVTTSIC